MTQDLSKFRRALAWEAGINLGGSDYAPTVESFRPWEDVAQAIRVFWASAPDTSGAEISVTGGRWYVTMIVPIKPGEGRYIVQSDASLPRSICLAVIQALDLKEDS